MRGDTARLWDRMSQRPRSEATTRLGGQQECRARRGAAEHEAVEPVVCVRQSDGWISYDGAGSAGERLAHWIASLGEFLAEGGHTGELLLHNLTDGGCHIGQNDARL
jgi:hypothetical protein